MPAALVCGSKRSYFLDEQLPSPPLSKRRRCSPSPSSSSPTPSSLHHLKSLCPLTDPEILENTLEECGNDLDHAIQGLRERCLGSAEHYSLAAGELDSNVEQGTIHNGRDPAAFGKELLPSNIPAHGAEWVDVFVREMTSATSLDDAKVRASSMLEMLEKLINARAVEESAQSFHKENMLLKEKIEVLIRENTILKKAVAIQHERQKEFEDKNRELHHLKQLVSQCHDQLRTLEINNYALMMRLRQAEQSSPIPGHFHPDVF